jgi:hypothetical protein
VDDNNFSSSPSYVDIEVNPSQQSNVPSPSDSQKAQSPQTTTSDYSGIVIFIIFLVIIAAIIIKLRHRSGKYRGRRYFPEYVKKETLRDENYKCAICKRSAGIWDFDHVDGNRSNNDTDNCQALCPNCHAKKSRGLLRQEKKSSSLHRLKVGIIIILVILLIIIILSFLIGTYSNVNQPITSSP